MKLIQIISIDVRRNCRKKKISAKNVIGGVIFNPAIRFLFFFRIAQYFRCQRYGFWISEFFWNLSVLSSACHISIEANIRPGVIFPHPVGIVIGAGVRICTQAVIYQNVTLGLRSRGSVKRPKYPQVKRFAVIYSGACVVGDVTVGQGAVVGANVVVGRDVENGEKVMPVFS